MKKKNIINLIKYYTEKNDIGFRNEAYEIANDFDHNGDNQLAEYIMALLSDANTFVPQVNENEFPFLELLTIGNDPLPLPDTIENDILGLVNAVDRHVGINKFLFQGAPGTGKTETAKHVARILRRDLYCVDFSSVIESRLGQTSKNITELFREINSFSKPDQVVILFDEIDSIALDRTSENDLREMGRATSSILKELDRLNDRVVLIATTNLFNKFDKALLRRFDSIIDFNRYTSKDLLDISEFLLNQYLTLFNEHGRNIRLFRKIISLQDPIPYPGDLKNIIRTAVAFSKPNDEFDYLRHLYATVSGSPDFNPAKLQKQGFTLREIEILSGISKSQVSRDLKEFKNE